MPEDGIGRNVGVVGRDIGVGIELEVEVVAFVLILLLPSVDVDKRDCGRLLLMGRTLCDNTLGARLPGMLVGEGDADVIDSGRNDDGALGLDVRRISFSLFFTGDGESSMIRTHPEVSPAGVLRFSFSSSALGLRIFIVLSLSS